MVLANPKRKCTTVIVRFALLDLLACSFGSMHRAGPNHACIGILSVCTAFSAGNTIHTVIYSAHLRVWSAQSMCDCLVASELTGVAEELPQHSAVDVPHTTWIA